MIDCQCKGKLPNWEHHTPEACAKVTPPAVCTDPHCPDYSTEHGHSTAAPARPYLTPKQPAMSRWGRFTTALGNSLGDGLFGGKR